MHAAGVEFDYALLVWASAESDILIIGIVFRALDDLQRSIQRVCSTGEQLVAIVNPVVAVLGANENWKLGGTLGLLTIGVLRKSWNCCRANCRSGQKVTSRNWHGASVREKRKVISLKRCCAG